MTAQTIATSETNAGNSGVASIVKLWRAVLYSALEDLKLPLNEHKQVHPDAISACMFLLTGGGDDRIAYSDIDPEFLRHKIIRQSIKGDGEWRRARANINFFISRYRTHADSCNQLEDFREFMATREANRSMRRVRLSP